MLKDPQFIETARYLKSQVAENNRFHATFQECTRSRVVKGPLTAGTSVKVFGGRLDEARRL